MRNTAKVNTKTGLTPLTSKMIKGKIGTHPIKKMKEEKRKIKDDGNEGGVITADYVRTMNIDEPLARFTPNSSRFYKQDALGSVIALTDEAGVVRTTYTYDPFGNTTVSGEVSDNPFQYTGRENDQLLMSGVEGGLYYYRARYYSPALQRFTSEDPLGLAGGDVNFYAYVENSPVNLVDPLGLSPQIQSNKKPGKGCGCKLKQFGMIWNCNTTFSERWQACKSEFKVDKKCFERVKEAHELCIREAKEMCE